MAPNDHLLEKFNASEETHNLALELLRIAQVKTKPGSGRDVKELTAGMPAACVLLASERLKNGEFDVTIQKSSSLKPKAFTKVYELVKAAVNEEENVSDDISYEDLYARYKLQSLEKYLADHIDQPENALMTSGREVEKGSFTCATFFWLCSAVRPKGLPTTEIFARNHKISYKSLVDLLNILNANLLPLRKALQIDIKKKRALPVEPPSSANAVTPTLDGRQSLRKAAQSDVSSEAMPKAPVPDPTTQDSEDSPFKRVTRGMTASPTKASPTKVTQLPTPTRLPWKKGPLRELPSKNTPKKRVSADGQDQMDTDEIPETPTKKRRVETRTVSSTPLITASSSRLTHTPAKNSHIFPSVTRLPSTPSVSRLAKTTLSNVTHIIPLDELLPSEESEPEELGPKRRFRPVYLEHRQWAARDPRLAKIWRKADKKSKLSLDPQPFPRYSERQT